MKSVFHCQSCDFSPSLSCLFTKYLPALCMCVTRFDHLSLCGYLVLLRMSVIHQTVFPSLRVSKNGKKLFFVLSGNCLTFQSWLNWRKRESCNWTAVSVSKCFLMGELCGSPLCKRLNSVVLLQSFSKLSNQRNMNGKIRLFSFKLRCQL